MTRTDATSATNMKLWRTTNHNPGVCFPEYFDLIDSEPGGPDLERPGHDRCDDCRKRTAHALGCYDYESTCRCCLGCADPDAVWLLREPFGAYCSDCLLDEPADEDTEVVRIPDLE